MEPCSNNENLWSVGHPENPSTDDWRFSDEVSAHVHAKIRSGSRVIAVWNESGDLDCLYFGGEIYVKK